MTANPGSASKTTNPFSKIKTYLTGMHSTSVHLMGGCLMGVYLTGVYLISVCLMGVYLTGVRLMGVSLIGVCLYTSRALHVMGVHLAGVHVMGIHFMGIHLIYESSLRARHGWRESLYRHPGCFKASDCGRLGRQVAVHSWSELRVVKSCRKDFLTAKVLLEAKAAALHPEWYQSLLSKLSTKEGEVGKRSAGNRIG
jgi:hypothetical protein